MPVTASDLIKGQPAPVAVQLDDPVRTALDIMVSKNYSQLPIVDENQRPTGVISAISILSGLAHLGVTVEQLRVRDLAERHQSYTHDADIFELLDGLNTNSAVLINDYDGQLLGIITDWDTANYFRRRAEDLMLIEDIEAALKDHIDAAFCDPGSGLKDEIALNAAISEVASAQAIATGEEAIKRYQVASSAGNIQVDAECLAEVREHFRSKSKKKEIKDLTLYQLGELFTHKSRWAQYGQQFSFDDKVFRRLLKTVSDARNTIAHFRDELTPSQRSLLRFCATWFSQNGPNHPVSVESPELNIVPESILSAEEFGTPSIVPVGEVLSRSDSRYARLATFLRTQISPRLQLSISEIETVLGGALPPSAHSHRSWWANDSVGHVQSQEWLDVGWRVAEINLTNGVITFARMKERESLYISFFSTFLKELRDVDAFPIKPASPTGASWHILGNFRNSEGMTIASLGISFTRKKRFRVELYIDSGDEIKNKQVFDLMRESGRLLPNGLLTEPGSETDFYPLQVFQEIWETIEWERLDHRRASRLAIYHPGTILEDPLTLATLRIWGLENIIPFHRAVADTLAPHGYTYSV